jgi:hypothetical protein
MLGAIRPLPQYAFLAWCTVKARGQLYLYIARDREKERERIYFLVQTSRPVYINPIMVVKSIELDSLFSVEFF